VYLRGCLLPAPCYTRFIMVRVILGIIKGALIGAGLGYAAMQIGVTSGPLAYATYAAVGFLVGLVCGKAVWRQETLWTPALKGLFGAAVCAGLYWGASKLLGGMKVDLPPQLAGGEAGPRALVEVPLLVAPIVAIVYGIFVEIDDGERKAKPPAAAA
jgi:hypothetical protein